MWFREEPGEGKAASAGEATLIAFPCSKDWFVIGFATFGGEMFGIVGPDVSGVGGGAG